MKIRQAKKVLEIVRQWEFTGKEYGVPFPVRWDTYNKAYTRNDKHGYRAFRRND